MGSIIDGQPVNATVTNASKLDRQTDDSAFGIITLANSNPVSGPQVDNVQADINDTWETFKTILRFQNGGVGGWNGSQITFTDNIEIVFTDSIYINSILASNSPITLADGEHVYCLINRGITTNTLPVIATTVPQGKNYFRIATRLGDQLYLYDNTTILPNTSFYFGNAVSGGSSGGFIPATFYDPLTTTLPTGTSFVVDGVAIANGESVLFSNLSSFNNQIWTVSGVGFALVWTAQSLYQAGAIPSMGEAVRIKRGVGFNGQIAYFDGVTFKINDTVRYFNGADYWEVSSLKTSTLLDNSTGTVFSVGYVGSENIIVDYSIQRAFDKEIGSIYVTTDGTNVSVSTGGTNVGACGVEFFGDLSGPNIRLRYTTTNTGSAATMKYYVKRWSNSAGGPGGPPTYSSGVSPISAAGVNGSIQINSGGLLGSDAELHWDTFTRILTLGAKQIVTLQTTTIIDNTMVATPILGLSALTYRFMIVEYSIERNGNYRVGRMLITHDGTTAELSDDYQEAGPLGAGVIFTASINLGNLYVNYISTSTGFNATFKYEYKRWN